VFASGINALVQVAQQKVDNANQQALEDAEKQRQTLGQRSQLDELLSSSSVLDLRSSNLGDQTPSDLPHAAASSEVPSLHDDLAGGDSAIGDIAAVLIEYQKLANKEAREDRKLMQEDKALAATSTSAKLTKDNEAIQQALNAADQAYAQKMDAATFELVVGAAGGSFQKGEGTASFPLVGTEEASLEHFIAASARLVQGDVRKDLEAMKDRLDELKDTKKSLALVASSHAGVLNGVSDALAAVDVEIEKLLKQVQDKQAVEQSAKDSSNADGTSTSVEAQLEKSAQAYRDMLNSLWP
jgi:hypothetical protein